MASTTTATGATALSKSDDISATKGRTLTTGERLSSPSEEKRPAVGGRQRPLESELVTGLWTFRSARDLFDAAPGSLRPRPDFLHSTPRDVSVSPVGLGSRLIGSASAASELATGRFNLAALRIELEERRFRLGTPEPSSVRFMASSVRFIPSLARFIPSLLCATSSLLRTDSSLCASS